MQKYITSLYWAVTTIVTVGYGDIIPNNDSEFLLVVSILIGGVAIFSFLISNLSNHIVDFSKSAAKRHVCIIKVIYLLIVDGLLVALNHVKIWSKLNFARET
jgi:hypothetical protein